MKRTIALATVAILSISLSATASAAGPVPMVDVAVKPEMAARTRTAVPTGFTDTVQKAYIKALNDEVQAEGKLDVIAVGRRATVVITQYYDPEDFETQAMTRDNETLNRFNPGRGATGTSFERAGLPERAYVDGYIEFDGQRMPFKEVSMYSTASFLAATVGRESFRRIRAL